MKTPGGTFPTRCSDVAGGACVAVRPTGSQVARGYPTCASCLARAASASCQWAM